MLILSLVPSSAANPNLYNVVVIDCLSLDEGYDIFGISGVALFEFGRLVFFFTFFLPPSRSLSNWRHGGLLMVFTPSGVCRDGVPRVPASARLQCIQAFHVVGQGNLMYAFALLCTL